ncbi:MAG: hypothetical protein LBH59_09240 [Planctomycetaceae bacterium]|jgi:hypothetical protein|nr:hypothetical protein [Planctomycetaceae bacterium]
MYDLVWIKKYTNKFLLMHNQTKQIIGYIEVYPKDGINADYDCNFCYCNIKYKRTLQVFLSVNAGYRWLALVVGDLLLAPLPDALDYPRRPHPK